MSLLMQSIKVSFLGRREWQRQMEMDYGGKTGTGQQSQVKKCWAHLAGPGVVLEYMGEVAWDTMDKLGWSWAGWAVMGGKYDRFVLCVQ